MNDWQAFLARTPLPPIVRRDIERIETAKIDYLPDLTSDQKKDRLSRISYRDYLPNVAKVDPAVIPFYQTATQGEWGVGIDAVSALDCWGFGLSGFQGLKLNPGSAPRMGYTPAGYADGGSYTFHFPDGNATIARLLVRNLVPTALPGHDCRDVVTAQADIRHLDRAGQRRAHPPVQHCAGRAQPARSRRPQGRGRSPTPARGRVFSVQGQGLRPGVLEHDDPLPLSGTAGGAEGGAALPRQDAAGLHHRRPAELARVPQAGRSLLSAPRAATTPSSASTRPSTSAPTPPSARPTSRSWCTWPARPAIRACPSMSRTEPAAPNCWRRRSRPSSGTSATSSAALWLAGGFDPARDITAITVNRWPHGYAPEYNPLWEPDLPSTQQPNVIGRARFGRITIANAPVPA